MHRLISKPPTGRGALCPALPTGNGTVVIVETSLFIQPHIGKWWKVPNLTYTRMTYAGVVLSPLLRLPDPGWRVSVK